MSNFKTTLAVKKNLTKVYCFNWDLILASEDPLIAFMEAMCENVQKLLSSIEELDHDQVEIAKELLKKAKSEIDEACFAKRQKSSSTLIEGFRSAVSNPALTYDSPIYKVFQPYGKKKSNE